MARQPFRLLSLCLVVACALPSIAYGQDLDDADRRLRDIEADAERLRRVPLKRSQLRSATHVEERLTDGELFYRLQDYVRASVIFTDIVENYPSHRAYPDALFLLADSLFRAGDHLGARSRFRKIIDRADEAIFRPFVQRSLGRLIEIAIHIRDFDGVDAYFARLSQLPPSEVEAATAYYRAKYLYNVAVPEGTAEAAPDFAGVDQAKLEQARVAFEAVLPRSPYHAQARYFIGVIYTLRKQYTEAIQNFKAALSGKVETDEQRTVADLAQLALGRLHYEADQLEQAVTAYQGVPRSSSKFDLALYEIAWAYIRMGDSTRAERSLEVLGVAVPDSQYIPDGKILRGNLLLRNGRFSDATEVFKDVASQFEPVREELDELVAKHEDPAVYFQQMVRDNLEVFDVNTFIPPAAQRWVTVEGDMSRAMSALEDLSQARQLVRETEDIVRRLTAALASKNRVNLFADLRNQREQSVALRNRLAKVRRTLMRADERATAGLGSAELTQVRKQRRELERRLGGIPTDQQDFATRNARVGRAYSKLEKQLSALEVELMGMEARIVATERFMADTFTGSTQSDGNAALQTELQGQRQAVEAYRQRVRQLRLDSQTGRLQVGVGDQNFNRDQELRKEHQELVKRERAIVSSLGGRSSGRIDAMFRRLDAVELQLDAQDAAVEEVVTERAASMQKVLNEESQKLTGYTERMAALEQETELVIGGIAYANFNDVRKRFYDLVLKADVGVIDVAWAQREEHRMRVEMLTRERTRAVQALDDEFAEIMDRKDQR